MMDDTSFPWGKLAIILITLVAIIIGFIVMRRITSIFG
jgi:hypothetical protein